MNDVSLAHRLAALREAPPASDFEARLQESLLREARQMREQRRQPLQRRPLRGTRRWGGRLGIGVAVVFGASAAAAAAGWFTFVPTSASRAVPAPAVEAVSVKPATREKRAPGALPAPTVALPEPVTETPHPVPDPELSPTSLKRRPVAPAHASSFRENAALPKPRERTGAHAPPWPLPHPSGKTHATKLLSIDDAKSGPTESARRVPMPEPLGLPEMPIGRREGAQGPRSLPELDTRSERSRERAERSERERGAATEGRGTPRERRSREDFERGIDRAKEARERKGP